MNFDKYIKFINDLNYEYDERIKNLLYLAIPAFIKYYEEVNELIILNVLKETRIIVDDKQNENVPAYFFRVPKYNNGNLEIDKYIVIQNLSNSLTPKLVDSIIHEFNHAINSYLKPYSFDEDFLYLRTGLTKIKYEKDSLNPVSKDNSYILEEIINSYQTEKIVNIICDFKNYDINNNIINSVLFVFNDNYKANSYYLESKITSKLINNKTFISTIEKLRLKGFVEDIESWFNSIALKKDSYKVLINDLIKLSNYENSPKNIFLKNKWKNDLIKLYEEIDEIVELFNKSTNYR